MLNVHAAIITDSVFIRSRLPDGSWKFSIGRVKDSKHTPPYKTLGTHLKYLRERINETVAEVSGAVEIDDDKLEHIEQGIERPSEEILMLLISHFNVPDNEAVQIWELAGYDRRLTPDANMSMQDDAAAAKQPMVMLLAVDVRAQYTDGVEIAANNAGLTMNFTQCGGQEKPQPVAKVGMSLEQAESVMLSLQRALLHARYKGPKALPAPMEDSSTEELA